MHGTTLKKMESQKKNIMTGEVDYLEPHGDGKASTILVVSDQRNGEG